MCIRDRIYGRQIRCDGRTEHRTGKRPHQAEHSGRFCRYRSGLQHRTAGEYRDQADFRQDSVCALPGVVTEYHLQGKEVHLCHERTDRKIRGRPAGGPEKILGVARRADGRNWCGHAGSAVPDPSVLRRGEMKKCNRILAFFCLFIRRHHEIRIAFFCLRA